MADYRVPILETFEFQPSVSGQLADPPVAPSRGDRHLIISPATGDWAGKETQITYCSNATGPVWNFILPLEGMFTWIQDEDMIYLYDGNSWGILGLSGEVGSAGGTFWHPDLSGKLDPGEHPQFALSGEYVGLSGNYIAHRDSVANPHQTTLDQACDLGNTTDQDITAANLKANGNIYVNFDGPNGLSYVYFYSGTTTGASIKYDYATERFEFSHTCFANTNFRAQTASGASTNARGFHLAVPSQSFLYGTQYLARYGFGGHTISANDPDVAGIRTYISSYYGIGLFTDDKQRLFVRSGGNVGINCNDAAETLDVSGTVRARGILKANTDVYVGDNLYVNYGGADGDSYIYFYDGGSNTGAYLKWNNTDARHEFSSDLFVSGQFQASQMVKQLWGTVVRVVAKNSKGDYATVQSAVGAASSGDTLLIMPGTYDESIVLKDGVNLVGIDRDNCILKFTGESSTVICGTAAATSMLYNLTIDHHNAVGASVNVAGAAPSRGILELHECTILSSNGATACNVAGGTLKLSNCIVSCSQADGIYVTAGYGSYPGIVYAEHSSIHGYFTGYYQYQAFGDSKLQWCDISGTTQCGASFDDPGSIMFEGCRIEGGSNDAAVKVANGVAETECRFTNCHLVSHGTNLIDLESGSATIGMYNCTINNDTKPAGLTVISGAEATNYGRTNISRASGAARTGTIHLPVAAAIIGDETAGSAGAGLSIYTTTDVTDPQVRHFVLAFDPTTDEHAFWQFRMPSDYAAGGTLALIFYMGADQADNTKKVDFEVAVQAITPNSDTTGMSALDITTDGGSWVAGTTTLNYANPATAGRLLSVSIDLSSNMDSASAGDFMILGLRRDADDGTNDTAAGDAIVVAVSFEYVRG